MLVKKETQQEQIITQVKDFCKSLDIPIQGVTILGGKPYVNKIGLLHKAHQIGLRSIRTERQQNAHETENKVAGYKAIVEMKDGSIFEAEGWASPMSIQMKTLHNPDFINMTCETRAMNRALSRATGCGYVSAEEIEPTEDIETIDYHETQVTNGSPKAITTEAGERAEALPARLKDTQITTGNVFITQADFQQYKEQCLGYVNEDILKKLAGNLKLDGRKVSTITKKEIDDLLAAAMDFKQRQDKEKEEGEKIPPFPIGEKEEEDVEQEDTADIPF